jgi:RHS repeat-associated protein
MTDPLGRTSYGYDNASRLTSYTNALGSNVSYGYDLANNVKTLTYPDGKAVTYTYDQLNRIKTVTNWLSQTATYNYDNAGRLTSFINFNGTITNYSYDNANRLTGLAHTTSNSTPLINYSFTLDNNGNRTQITQLEPLTTTINLQTSSYVYNTAKNRLTSLSGLSFDYDNEGQTISDAGTAYGYDIEHRIISGPGETFSYDGASRRLKAIRFGAETHYVYDASGNLLAETNNTNTITRYYIYGAGLIAMVDAATGKIYCYHFNALGNTIALTNSTQAIVNSYAYTPFGVVTEQQQINQPFKYVGQYGVYTEPSGLYYMRARYYDPSVGRFISEDPSGFGGGDVNLYAYVGGNPICFTDPLGLLRIGNSISASVITGQGALSLSATVGVNIDGWNSSIYGQVQVAGGLKSTGLYAGATEGPGIDTSGTPKSGVVSAPYYEGDVGVGLYSAGVNGNSEGMSISGGKGGAGYAAGVGNFSGDALTVTAATPSVQDVVNGASSFMNMFSKSNSNSNK